jgi:hypothetical protein
MCHMCLCVVLCRFVRQVADDTEDFRLARKPLSQITPADEFEGKITPEDICLLERSLSSEEQLIQIGIHTLMDVQKVEQTLARLNKLKKFKRDRLKAVKDHIDITGAHSGSKKLNKLSLYLEMDLDILKTRLSVARYRSMAISSHMRSNILFSITNTPN